MKPLPASFILVLFSFVFSMPGCRRSEQKMDVPDVQSIYRSISYLDTMIRSEQIDSIGRIHDQLTATLSAYLHRAQTPEDAVILDSLNSINSNVHELLQFCNTTITNLEMLEQDARALENQYRSGKIKINVYLNALLETEQILVEIDNQLVEKHHRALQNLEQQSVLIGRLSPLPVPAN